MNQRSTGAHPEFEDAGVNVSLGDAAAPLPPAEPPAPFQLAIDAPYPVGARPQSQNPEHAVADDEELARWNIGSGDPSSPGSNVSYHPGTRVVVDTRRAKLRPGAVRGPAPRGLTLDRVQAITRSRGYWPFRRCFEAGQQQKNGDGGETRVAFTIGTQGRVRAARLLDSQLGNPSVAACITREVLKLEFSPKPSRALAMVASIKLWPGDADAASASEPPVSETNALSQALAGEFDPLAAHARILEKQADIAQCFRDARRADPMLWGRLALTVVLEIDGSVHRVSETETRFPNAGATRCVQVLLSRVQFPSVKNKPFSFVVPFRLSPDPKATEPSPDEEDPGPADGASDEGSAD